MDDTNDQFLKETDPKLWSCIDVVVLQWIYDTISDDFLNTILNMIQWLNFLGTTIGVTLNLPTTI